jgi:hypothetical protein
MWIALLEGISIVLEHTDERCTGNWRLVGTGEDRRIACERCGAAFRPTPENRLAAIDENYAGIYLRRLTAEGLAQREDRDAA